jgi:hypothetical protein
LGVLSALVFTLYLKGLVRVSAIHMALSVIPAFITFGAVAEQAFGKHLPRSRWGAARLSETSGCGKLNRNRRYRDDSR